MWAAGIMALYGPLIYFDAQPLIPVLHIFLMLAGLLLLLRAAGVPEPSTHPRRDWIAAGLAWGLAAIATPNLLVCAPLAAIWARRRSRPAAAPLVLFLCGIALPVGLVTLRNVLVTGEWVLISSNSGINLYIGNNPDYGRRSDPPRRQVRRSSPRTRQPLTASGKSAALRDGPCGSLTGEPLAARAAGHKAAST